jgi:hypothetical protein
MLILTMILALASFPASAQSERRSAGSTWTLSGRQVDAVTLCVNTIDDDPAKETKEAKEAPARGPLFAVKTNLLLDAASALNAEIEVPLGRRWSLAGEWIFPWWLRQERQRALQLGVGTLEARRWLGDRENRLPMTGWFAGLYAGAGYYDIEWEDKGYQGELFHAGLSAGYAHAISRGGNWRMEYSLGAGCVRTRYREYTPRFGADDEWHLIRRRSGNHTWVGPARAEISLVLMLGRKGGGR